MLNKIKKWLPSKRKFMQLYFALLFNANLKGFVTGNIYQGNTKKMCAPGINCYSCPGAVGACPLGSLQGAFSASHSTLYYVGGILLLYCIMFGRMICGWLCPFGLIQELVHKIPTPKLKKSPVTRILSYLKYVILVFFVFIVPIMYAFRDTPLPAFCKYICPAGTLEGGIGLLSNAVNNSYFSMLGPLFTWKFMLMVSIILGSVFIFRLFCRFLCPLGALYGLFNRISIFGIKVDNSKCTDCGLCHSKCKVDIRHPGDQECISCGACVSACPTKAISWKGPKIFLRANEGLQDQKSDNRRLLIRCILSIAMIGLLLGVLGYYNSEEDPSSVSSWTPPTSVVDPSDPAVTLPDWGNTEGTRCYNWELPIVDSTGDTGNTFDPTATGKITVINFWGTWCTPCVAELPYFDQIATEYGDEVCVVAIHSAGQRDTAPAYIAEHYPDSNIVFSWDSGDAFASEYYTTLGGRGTYPYTLVLNENGVITKVFFSSVDYNDLKEAVEASK